MPETEAPADFLEATSSQTSVVEATTLSETESLTFSDYEFEISVANSVSSSSDSDIVAETSSISPVFGFDRIRIPLEQDLRQLLIKVTETQDLDTVRSVRLRVIARDFSLQRLPLFLPALRELILDGSCLMTLRDLGCGLHSLAILRVARTGLNSLDGLFGLPSLVELHAAHNNIRDLSPCAALAHVHTLDLAHNVISEVSSVSFLVLCASLQHLILEGNPTARIIDYYAITKVLLPDLVSLDGVFYPEEDRSIEEKTKKASPVRIISRFPPIPQRSLQQITPNEEHNKNTLIKQIKRPNTTGSIGTRNIEDKLKMLPIRPATARKATEDDFSCIVNGSHLKLKDIRQLFVPSKLTSGKPICGNPALALWENKHGQAWEKD